MAWFRLGGAGISAALKNAMNAVLNKKLGTSQVYDPNEWPDEVNLLGALEEKTVSSSPIVTFPYGADAVPLKKCEITLPASLDGYSSVDVVSAGKNLVDGTDFTRGLPSTTIGANIDTISASTRYAYFGTAIKGGVYTVSSVSNDADYYNAILIFGYTNGILSFYTNASVNASKTIDLSACDYARIAIGSRTVQITVPTDFTDYGTIQFEVGSTATTYEPYTTPTTHTASLGRTIYGGTVDVVNGTAEPTNLLDVPAREEMTRNGIVSSISADGTIIASGQSTGNGDIIVTLGTSVNLIGGETYTFSIIGTDTRSGSVYVYFTGGSYISINNANHSGTYTPSADQTITGVTLRTFNTQTITLSAKIQLEKGSTSSDYSPYFAPFTFDPVPIDSKLGNNTIWSEQGNAEVTYRSQGTAYIYPEGEGVSF